MIIILICAGNYQEYIVQNIEQLIKLDYNIHVIIDKSFRKKLKRYKRLIKISFTEELETDFDKKSKLNKTFRGGLAHFTSKRLFLLYRYMKKNNIENVIHLENDVLLYSKMDFNFDKTKIYLTMHSEVNCIPGIMYIPKFKLLKNLIKNYDYSRDDMYNVAQFYKNNKKICKTFPIINYDSNTEKNMYNENFDEFNSIFDAAAIGQYLGGTDPRNKGHRGGPSGYIRQDCVIRYDKYKFKWVEKDNYFVPHIEINNKLIPINNLHIHCKNLKLFKLDNPSKNNYIN